LTTFKLTLAYDGTDFVGWQRQAEGVSVQGLIEDALAGFGAGDVPVAGAGRTDAGVHARGQVASFTLAAGIDPATLVRALNAKLPETVRAIDAEIAAPEFHARFDARAKTYRYRIANGPVLSPFERRYAWHVPRRIDVDAMADAARRLKGRHDFAAFQSAGSAVRSTEREVFAATLSMVDEFLVFDIQADGFLRHMVRAIVGTLLEVGCGRRGADSIDAVLASRDRSRAGRGAPPHGLFLMAVEYNRRSCR
jgi:tRNA pseudouridine38-40 synthase